MTFPFNTRVVVGSSPYPTISAVIAFYGLNATSTVGVPDPSIPEAASYMFVSGGRRGEAPARPSPPTPWRPTHRAP